jgi:hypothetical protein
MINQIDPLNQFTWWSSLKHGGLLIVSFRQACVTAVCDS